VEDYEEGGLFPCNSCGTLEYLAPEALGDTRHVNSSVDVYAFGILMWELLTGCPPYMLLSHEDILEVGAVWEPIGSYPTQCILAAYVIRGRLPSGDNRRLLCRRDAMHPRSGMGA
jgi:serine/threonine protein kinase